MPLVALVIGVGCAPGGEPWREPNRIGGGCGGGKPDQGGTSYEARKEGDGFVIEVSSEPMLDRQGPEVSRFELRREEWDELVELVRKNDLWNWKPVEKPDTEHCVSCWASIDNLQLGYCGAVEGGDRTAGLRRKLEAFAFQAAKDPARRIE